MTNSMTGDPLTPLPEVARLGLTAGKLLLENGANGRGVHQAIAEIADGLQCDSAEVICQHAAVLVMIRRGGDHCMQMGKAGEHGVNLRRTQAVWSLVERLKMGGLDCASAQAAMDEVPAATPRYPVWFICLSAGLACSAFGRLLGAEWPAFLPTLLGASSGQFIRHNLLHRGHNIFVTAVAVSFVSALIAGLGAKACGSTHLQVAMLASVLMLVPGVAILNAQVDVLESKPNLAAARALRVLYILLFMTLGLALAQNLVIRHP